MRILLIEDDPKLGRLIVQFLQRHHHQIDHATTGHQGIDLLLNHMYDVAIIDWMLPDRDGPDICAMARAANIPTGLLMLTARSQVEDIVTGLRRGADDYLRRKLHPHADHYIETVRGVGYRWKADAPR